MKRMRASRVQQIVWTVLAATFFAVTALAETMPLWPQSGSLNYTPLSPGTPRSVRYVVAPMEFPMLYAPSGWMGDTSDLAISGYYRGPGAGWRGVLRVAYRAQGPRGWAGIVWQHPGGNWGMVPHGGLNLVGAVRLTFWACGDNGGEKITLFRVGGITGNYPDSASEAIGPLTLTRNWQEYAIDLSRSDLSHIAGGFSFVVVKGDNPGGCVFYLRGIGYESRLP